MKKILILCLSISCFNSFAMSPTDSSSIDKESISILEAILNTAEQNATLEAVWKNNRITDIFVMFRTLLQTRNA
ncbi:MAG: hypothetical protein H7336_03405 [Bacteriovorax sp.]|nr:hypothetical protein [Bacteriovorax sp.]